MGRAFSDIAFTPQVREIQRLKGSREQYAHLDHASDRGDRLGRREIEFIKEADHFYQATVSETGWPYVQHRGGPAGFLKIVDDKTLGFTDFVGNVQYISVGNLKKDDRIAMIFMDYANQRRLKVLGRARTVEIEDDPALIERLRTPGYDGRIERAFVITVEGFDWNCPQHITPRFTEAEIAVMVAPMQAQVRRLKEQLAQVATQRQPDRLGDGPLALTITGVRQLTKRVRAYELRDANGAALPEFQAGAHLDIPMQLADGTASTRCYSIASHPQRRNVYEIAVLREDDGQGGSVSVHDAFRVGLVLHCSLPRNDFHLVEETHRAAHPAVLIAGGIGITPIKAMAHALSAQGRPFELHYAVRSRSEAAFLEELEAEFGQQLILYPADQNIRLDVAALMKTPSPDTLFYVCGPSRLIEAVREAGRAAGIGDERIRFERFASAATFTNNRPITVTLARSGKVVAVPAERSILDVVQAAGIHAPASCRIGVCGTCAVKVSGGTPDHRDEVLSAEQRDGEKLMCICVSRATGNDLTIDL